MDYEQLIECKHQAVSLSYLNIAQFQTCKCVHSWIYKIFRFSYAYNSLVHIGCSILFMWYTSLAYNLFVCLCKYCQRFLNNVYLSLCYEHLSKFHWCPLLWQHWTHSEESLFTVVVYVCLGQCHQYNTLACQQQYWLTLHVECGSFSVRMLSVCCVQWTVQLLCSDQSVVQSVTLKRGSIVQAQWGRKRICYSWKIHRFAFVIWLILSGFRLRYCLFST